MLFALCKNEDNNTASMRIFLQVWIFFFCTLFWPITVWINCSCYLKNFANSRPSASNFKRFSRSLEQFFLTVVQNNFGNKIPFLCFKFLLNPGLFLVFYSILPSGLPKWWELRCAFQMRMSPGCHWRFLPRV